MPVDKMNNKKMLFVINPISGDIDKEHLENDINEFMTEHLQQVDFHYTSGENDQKKISAKIEKTGATKIVAVGGDGTCNMVAQILINKNLELGILPQGSANGMAKELELPDNIHENLNIILNGKSKAIDVLRFGNQHISLHLSDIGFNAKVIERFEKGDTRGILGYGKHFFDELGRVKPTKFKLEVDDKIIKKKAIMIVIANAAKYGTGAVVNPKGKVDDGKFEVIVFRPQKFIQFLKMAIPFFTRQIHQLEFVDFYSCKNVKIYNYKKQKLQIDGEIMGQPEQVCVELLPQSLKVIVP